MAPLADKRERKEGGGWRLRILRLFLVLFAVVIGLKLFYLQVMSAGLYSHLAEERHSLYEELVPRRGRILVKDYDDPTEYPVASVTQGAFIYADPRKVTDPVKLGKSVAHILNIEGVDEYEKLTLVHQLEAGSQFEQALTLKKDILTGREVTLPETDDLVPALFETTLKDRPNAVEGLVARLSKKDDPYEPIARNASEEQLELINALGDPAVDYILEDARSYPELTFGGHVIGFLGQDEAGKTKGFYGIEGFYDSFLSGTPGELYSQADVSGASIGVGNRRFVPAVDGGDVLLTIDRTVQVTACGMLKKGIARFSADGGALVIIEPSTGRILAMCGAPDFDPKKYGEVTDFSAYNNPAIFTPYEPGSIMKPLVMAAAIDVGAVTPNTTFTDTGSVKVDDFTIKNSADKVYGQASMIQVLEDSINTGMVWVMRKMGKSTLKDYLERYGFGALTGIELKTEAPGTIASLNESAEVYSATAAFGQGITTTPLQIAAGYAALANGGTYMKPHIVDELRYSDGTVEKNEPEAVRQIISPQTATTIGAMLISVVEYGHGKKAGVPGYYIAGKTGTAQIAEHGVYSETDFNGSFAGYGPAHDPKFAMIVKIENPKNIIYAESTAAPIFGEISKFLLEYYGVAPDRVTE
jgi:stage V sporulation protein D (sporulation-specific penicillin-binding protein)